LLGSFEEEFQFSVDGSDKKLELLIKGEVIGPTFRFQPSSIDFGTVSLGFEHQKGCKIINTSLGTVVKYCILFYKILLKNPEISQLKL